MRERRWRCAARDPERLARAPGLLGRRRAVLRGGRDQRGQLDEFIDATLERFGRLDGAVNNAGRSAGTSVATSSDDDWREDYELKVISALHVSRRVLPALECDQGRDRERARDHGAHAPARIDPDHGVASRGTRAHQGPRQRGGAEGDARQRRS